MFGTDDRVAEDCRWWPKSDDPQGFDRTPRGLPPLADGLVVAVEDDSVRSDVDIGALQAQVVVQSQRSVAVGKPHVVHDVGHDVRGQRWRDDVTSGVADVDPVRRDERACADVEDDSDADTFLGRPSGLHLLLGNCIKPKTTRCIRTAQTPPTIRPLGLPPPACPLNHKHACLLLLMCPAFGII